MLINCTVSGMPCMYTHAACDYSDEVVNDGSDSEGGTFLPETVTDSVSTPVIVATDDGKP